MDYTTHKFGFKVKKALRYLRLYGLLRTLIKIQGQFHMKKRYASLPVLDHPAKHEGRVGLIGCGNFGFSNIAYYIRKADKNILRGAMDADIHRAASLYENYDLAYYSDDANKIISDPLIDIVYIASNHASHAEYAIKCIEAGKHVHIEKPHVVTRDQLDRLLAVMACNPEVKVFLGFNRPRSPMFKKLQRVLAKESGPLMINWFIAGHQISDDHWYFDEKEGGRILGNLCHWSDLTLQLVSLDKAFPCTIIPATPVGAKSDFVVSIVFADSSCASITFSAKGHTFEGVREILNVHKGNVLANISDFQKLTIDINEKKYKVNTFYRDHGHQINILNSLDACVGSSFKGESACYVKATALLFLGIKDAVDSGENVVITKLDVVENVDLLYSRNAGAGSTRLPVKMGA